MSVILMVKNIVGLEIGHGWRNPKKCSLCPNLRRVIIGDGIDSNIDIYDISQSNQISMQFLALNLKSTKILIQFFVNIN